MKRCTMLVGSNENGQGANEVLQPSRKQLLLYYVSISMRLANHRGVSLIRILHMLIRHYHLVAW